MVLRLVVKTDWIRGERSTSMKDLVRVMKALFYDLDSVRMTEIIFFFSEGLCPLYFIIGCYDKYLTVDP